MKGGANAEASDMRRVTVMLLLTFLTRTALAQTMPSPGEQTQVIETARRLAREYRDNLPDFIAAQTVRRQALPKGSKTWKALDTLTLEVSFVEGREQFLLLTINGRCTTKTKAELDGVRVWGEFGSNLWGIFNPASEAKFKWERWTDLGGRPAHVFSYQIERDQSPFSYDFGDGHKRPVAMAGLVYIDRENHQVMRVTYDAKSMPADWPSTAVSSGIDFSFVDIAGRQLLLPLHAEARLVWRAGTVPATIVGIMPPGFKFPFIQKVWVPLTPAGNEKRDDRNLDPISSIRHVFISVVKIYTRSRNDGDS